MPQAIRAILLDAVGTAIYPTEDVTKTYAEHGRRHGSQVTESDLRSRFHAAFRRQEDADHEVECRASEPRERQRWHTIVSEVFPDVRPIEPLFEALWDHYRKRTSWRVFPDVAPFIRSANEQSIRIVLASNFDARLREIVQGLDELSGIHDLAISSELGWKKPSVSFYHAILSRLELAPNEVIAVGDDVINDYEAARVAEIISYLVIRQSSSVQDHQIRSLAEIPSLLEENA